MAENVRGTFGQEEINLQNAATEATLQQLLDAMKIVAAKSAKEFKSDEELEQGLAKLAKLSKGQLSSGKKQLKQTRSFLKTKEEEEEVIKEAVKAYDEQVKSLQEFKADMEKAGTVITGFISKISNAANAVQGMDGSISSAVGALGQIPMGVGAVIEGVFGPVAAAVDKTHQAFLDASSVGANFGGNMRDLLNAAGEGGLQLQELTGIIKNNGQSLVSLGGSTAEGAKRLAKFAKDIRKTEAADDLARLGFSTEAISDGFAKYSGLMAKTGRLQNMTDAQLRQGTVDYLKQLDAVSKLTGKNKEALQAEADARMNEAAYRAALAKMDPKEAAEMEKLMASVPAEHAKGLRSIIARGAAIGPEAERLAAFMPDVANAAMEMNANLKAGKDLGQGFSENFYNLYNDSAVALTNSGVGETMALYNDELNQFMVDAYNIRDRGNANLKQIEDEQKKKLEELKNAPVPDLIDPATVQAFKQNITEKSLEMTEALASIDLTKLETVFNKAADLAIEYLPKAINAAAENFELVAGTVLALNSAALLAAGALKMLSLSAGGSLMGNRGLTNRGKANASGMGPDGKKGLAKGAAKGILRRFGPIAALMSAYEGVTGYNEVQAQVDAGQITSSEGTVAKSEVVGESVGGGGGALVGAATGAAIGSVIPVVGTAVGGLIGGAIGWWAGSKAGSAIGETIGETIAGPDTIKEVEQRIADLNKAIEEDSFSSVGFSSKDEKAELEQLQKDLILLKQRQAEEEAKLKEAEGSPANPDKPANADPNSTTDGSSTTDASTTATNAQKSLEQQKEEADKKALEEAKKKEEELKKKTSEVSSAIGAKKSPEEVMLALNTNIEELVSLTRMSNALTQKHIGITSGLTNDAFTV